MFVSLPTLARMHDQLSTHDNGTSFRLSKNVDLPHEKIGGAALACCTTLALLHPDRTEGHASAEQPGTPAALPPVARLASRAPPVR